MCVNAFVDYNGCLARLSSPGVCLVSHISLKYAGVDAICKAVAMPLDGCG